MGLVQELPVTGHSHFTALFNSDEMHPALYLYSFAGFVFFTAPIFYYAKTPP